MNWTKQKPAYHFIPFRHFPEGTHFQDVMPLYARGEYHVYYEAFPIVGGVRKANIGLTSSRDLIHWVDKGLVLKPEPSGPDSNGCWTGCAVERNNSFLFLYTGVEGPNYVQTQCLAFSDDMVHWRKHPGNPVIAVPPEGISINSFRDPCIWRKGDSWRMVLGGSMDRKYGQILLYESCNLVDWHFLNVLWEDRSGKIGSMCECPDFFLLGDSYVLITLSITPVRKTWYLIGPYEDRRFTPAVWGFADFGDCLAAKTLIDAAGRRIIFGWIPETYGTSYPDFESTGVQSLPRRFFLREDGLLGMEPVPELQTLRDKSYQPNLPTVQPNTKILLEEVQGDCLEIEVELLPGMSEECGIIVRCSPDFKEYTRIGYNRRENQLYLDRSNSSTDQLAHRNLIEGDFLLKEGESLKLHVFLDRSVVEVFANTRACITGRIYPAGEDSFGLGFFSNGGSAVLKALQVWSLKTEEEIVRASV